MPRYAPLLTLLFLASACGGEVENASEIANEAAASPANGSAATEGDSPGGDANAGPAPATLEVGPLQVPYDSSQLAPVEVTIPLPPDWRNEAEGVKLIARDRVALLGKAECMYGQSGEASPCNALQEAGLAFVSLDRPYKEFAAALPADQRKSVSMAGAEGVSWLIGAEGEGAEYILLPSGEGSVLVVRQFRSTGNPDETALGTVLNDLRLRGTE